MAHNKISKTSLLSHAISIRKQIEGSEGPIPYRESYLKTLLVIEKILSDDASDINGLSQSAFGIFRMVDGPGNIPIEKELLVLVKGINELLTTQKESIDSTD